MKKTLMVGASVIATLLLGATSASATSNVVHHGDSWGRIVDGPRGKNTLVYACDGEGDGWPVFTQVKAYDRRNGDLYYVSIWDLNGPNNGCEGLDTTEVVNPFTYANELRVCEDQPIAPYCTQFYPTNW